MSTSHRHVWTLERVYIACEVTMDRHEFLGAPCRHGVSRIFCTFWFSLHLLKEGKAQWFHSHLQSKWRCHLVILTNEKNTGKRQIETVFSTNPQLLVLIDIPPTGKWLSVCVPIKNYLDFWSAFKPPSLLADHARDLFNKNIDWWRLPDIIDQIQADDFRSGVIHLLMFITLS